MDYEKKYNEALERAKNLRKDAIDMGENIRAKQCEIIFPELTELEDERIRKALIEMFSNVGKKDWRDIPTEKIIAWLEKQSEQKSTDTCCSSIINDKEFPAGEKRNFGYFIKPKFHKGDWVILTAGELSTILQIVNVDTNKKLYWFNDSSYLPIVDEECLRLWTIQDAKDGDVLVSKYEQPFIYNGNYDEYNVGGYCGIVCDGSMFIETDTICQWADNKKIKPATNAQHDLLFQKMKDAGYEWDNEKKELKLLITNGGDFCESENCDQNPTWSEKDENMFKSIIATCELAEQERDSSPARHLLEMQINWLKSIKQRMKGE